MWTELSAPHPRDKLLHPTDRYRCYIRNIMHLSEAFLHPLAASKTSGYHVICIWLEMIPAELEFLTIQTLPCLNICLVKANNYSFKFIHYIN
jgi:hypothetical protein